MRCVFKPAVSKKYLLIIAGMFWSFAGLLLLRFSFIWAAGYQGRAGYLLIALVAGLLLGFLIALLGFRQVASKNIDRINRLPELSCIFAFQKWQGYLIVIFMMSLGILMRRTHLLPQLYMLTTYLGIGSALFSTSFMYYKSVISLEYN